MIHDDLRQAIYRVLDSAIEQPREGNGRWAKTPGSRKPITPKPPAVLASFLSGKPVAEIPGNQAPQAGFSELRRWAGDLFARQGGKAISPEVGEVLLDERAVRDSLGHGISRVKAEAFAAVKDVIEKGHVVLVEPAHNRKETDSIYISAPVKIGGVEDIVTVLAHRDINTQRMYLHSVTTKENLLGDGASGADGAKSSERTGSSHEGGISTVLRTLVNFKEA